MLDTLGEYLLPGAFRVATFDDLLEALEIGGGFQGRPFRIVYTPGDGADLALQEAFEAVCDLAASLDNVVLVVDEIALYVTPSSYPDPLDRVLRLGRHRGQSLIASTQRPADVPRVLSGMADVIVCFQTQEPRDVDYLKRYIGPRAAEGLRYLPVGEPRIYRAGEAPRDAEGDYDEGPEEGAELPDPTPPEEPTTHSAEIAP